MLLYLFWFVASVILLFGTLSKDKKTQLRWMIFFMLSLGIFVGLGDMLGGYDRYIYGELFDNMADVTRASGNPWRSASFAFFGSEFGYGSFCALVSFITSNRYIFIFLMTIVIYVLLIASLKDYVENSLFAVVMFMGLWFFFTFTYLRQVMAATIVWLSIRYIINRNWKLFLLVWFIGFSFHNSALIFLPMYFVPIRKFSREVILFVMVGALLIGITDIPRTLFAIYGEVDQERINVAGYEVDAGFRWAYFVEAVFFIYIILMNYRTISNKVKDIMMLNLSLAFCAILLVFIKSENGGRLGWFFMIGVMCTMSNICVKRRRVLSHGAMMIVVSFILFFRILNAWAFNLTPYKTFLTPGHTAAEWIYERYEYDTMYDKDKFYRK